MRVCVRAPFFRHPLTFFAFLPVLWTLSSSPPFRRSPSSFSFSFFFFFVCVRACVHTRAILCALYFSSRIRGCTRHFLLSLLLNSVTFTSGDVSLHRIDIRLRIVFLSVSPKFHVYIYTIYTPIYTYIIYTYIYILCITVSAVSPHVSHRFLPWPTPLKKLFGYEKETKREIDPLTKEKRKCKLSMLNKLSILALHAISLPTGTTLVVYY